MSSGRLGGFGRFTLASGLSVPISVDQMYGTRKATAVER
jgi:hypothetical protein